MPSNNDLRKEALSLAESLEVEIKVEGLNNQELSSLVSDLKAKLKDKENTAAEDAMERAAEDEAETTVEEPKPPYYVMPGKSITCSKGVLSDGKEVKAEWLGEDGKKALEALVSKGYVGETK